jgi:hypothetical protein
MSIKLVPGQLELWQMAADMSRFDKASAAAAFREYVGEVAKNQRIAPDVLPAQVNITPDIDQNGKLISYKA